MSGKKMPLHSVILHDNFISRLRISVLKIRLLSAVSGDSRVTFFLQVKPHSRKPFTFSHTFFILFTPSLELVTAPSIWVKREWRSTDCTAGCREMAATKICWSVKGLGSCGNLSPVQQQHRIMSNTTPETFQVESTSRKRWSIDHIAFQVEFIMLICMLFVCFIHNCRGLLSQIQTSEIVRRRKAPSHSVLFGYK